MKQTNIKLTQYRHGKFIITIEEGKGLFSAWLRHERYGIQTMMFGWPKKQPTGETFDYDAFMELVEGNLDEYIRIYKDEYCEE